MMKPVRILYVDDSILDRELVLDSLQKEHGGFEVTLAGSRAEFEQAIATEEFDLVLSDFNILGFEGLQVIATVHAKVPSIPVVIVTGTGSEEIAVEAMKRGAADYVIKSPKHIRRLPLTIHAALEKEQLGKEREQAYEELRQSEEHYRAIFEGVQDAIFVESIDGEILAVNNRACEMYGYSREEFLTKTVSDLIPPEHTAIMADSEGFLASREPLETVNRRSNGEAFPIEISGRLQDFGDKKYLLVVARDITRRKRAESDLKKQLNRITALNEIDRAITSSFDLNANLKVVLSHVRSHLGVDASAVLLLDPYLQTLRFKAGQGFYTTAIEKTLVRFGEEYAGRAVRERRLIQIRDLDAGPENPRMKRFLAEENFAYYCCVPLILKEKVVGVLEIFHRSILDPDQEWHNFFQTLAGQCAIAVDNATLFKDLQSSNFELRHAYDATIEGWSRALDLRDKETEGHTKRVTEMTIRLARICGLNEEELIYVRWGSLLHDIGKMGVPDTILLKPDKLSNGEWQLMKQHPVFAFEMLSPITYLKSAIDIPYCHHEKWDGTGYPRGLKGDQIPLAARIFAIVDVWDALNSDRPYRKAWYPAEILKYIESLAGQHFDPQIVKICLESGVLEDVDR